MRHRPALAAATAALAALGLTLPGTVAGAAAPAAAAAPATETPLPDTRGLTGPLHLSPELAAAMGTGVLDPRTTPVARPAASAARPAGEPAAVGATRLWPVVDFRTAIPLVTLRPFTLRALGTASEAWVAAGPEGTSFPPGDCRNARPDEIAVSAEQAKALVREFDTVIAPKEVAQFSPPIERDGTRTVPGIAAAGLDFSGSGKRTVLLVDNIRDASYDKIGESGLSGYYTPTFGAMTDRNIVTVDSYDWRHRTGAHPPDDSSDDLCKSRTSRPRYIESTLAHEWYHLIANDRDNLEPLWVDEGMAEYAMSVVGYPKTRRTIAQPGAERELICFQGYGTTKGPSNSNPVACGGPQNSLTEWEDEGDGHELLADYGNAWSFFLFLADRYGPRLMHDLHMERGAQGMAAVQLHVPDYDSGRKVEQLLHDFRLMNLLDRLADAPGAVVRGIDARRVRSASLSAALDLDNPAAYSAPGAGPNGADYLALGPGKDLRSVRFAGAVQRVDDADALLHEVTGALGFPVGLSRQPGLWQVDLVGLDVHGHRALVRSYKGESLALDAERLSDFAGYPQVVAVVGYDRVFNTGGDPGRYTLLVNGSAREGG